MITFCFNHCLGEIGHTGDKTNILIELLNAHTRFGKPKQYPIILPDSPEKIMIAGVSLKDLVNSIPIENINIRRLALSILVNYPLTSFFISEPDIEEDEWCNYQLFGQDAEALFWSYKMGWMVISMPICEHVKKDYLQLDSENKNKTIANWYGENISFIKGIEEIDKGECERRLTELEFLINGKTIILSESFKKEYRKAPVGLQDLVLKKVKDAYSANLLFPSRADDNLVKYCEGTGNENTYELRSKALGGMRVYFYSDENKMIVASLHTKAKSVGKEQSADINNASAVINKHLRND